MKNRFVKIGLLFLVLALALAAVGVGYAMWDKTLDIDGTVNTGTVTVGFTEVICAEMYEDPPGSGILVQGEVGGKDVGDLTCSFETLKEDPITGKQGFETILVQITDAYPCYHAHITFVVTNLGTVPVVAESLVVSDPTGELEWDAAGFLWKDFDGNGVYDTDEEVINVKVVDMVGDQIDPCNSNKAEVDLHLKQSAEQNHTYTVLVEISFIQWNEY